MGWPSDWEGVRTQVGPFLFCAVDRAVEMDGILEPVLPNPIFQIPAVPPIIDTGDLQDPTLWERLFPGLKKTLEAFFRMDAPEEQKFFRGISRARFPHQGSGGGNLNSIGNDRHRILQAEIANIPEFIPVQGMKSAGAGEMPGLEEGVADILFPPGYPQGAGSEHTMGGYDPGNFHGLAGPGRLPGEPAPKSMGVDQVGIGLAERFSPASSESHAGPAFGNSHDRGKAPERLQIIHRIPVQGLNPDPGPPLFPCFRQRPHDRGNTSTPAARIK